MTTLRDVDPWAYKVLPTSEWEVAQNSSVGAGQIDKGAVSGWVPTPPPSRFKVPTVRHPSALPTHSARA